MSKVELHKDIRVKRRNNYDQLKDIEQLIAKRIAAEYNMERNALRAENDAFNADEKSFYERVSDLLHSCGVETKFRVVTQTGPLSGTLREYTGVLSKQYVQYRDHSMFDFIDPNFLDGKPFTIGFSCLQSIEVIPNESPA